MASFSASEFTRQRSLRVEASHSIRWSRRGIRFVANDEALLCARLRHCQPNSAALRLRAFSWLFVGAGRPCAALRGPVAPHLQKLQQVIVAERPGLHFQAAALALGIFQVLRRSLLLLDQRILLRFQFRNAGRQSFTCFHGAVIGLVGCACGVRGAGCGQCGVLRLGKAIALADR